MCNKWHTRVSIDCMHALTIISRVPVASCYIHIHTHTHNCLLNFTECRQCIQLIDSLVCHLLHIQSIVHCVLPFLRRTKMSQRTTLWHVTACDNLNCIDLCMRVGVNDAYNTTHTPACNASLSHLLHIHTTIQSSVLYLNNTALSTRSALSNHLCLNSIDESKVKECIQILTAMLPSNSFLHDFGADRL